MREDPVKQIKEDLKLEKIDLDSYFNHAVMAHSPVTTNTGPYGALTGSLVQHGIAETSQETQSFAEGVPPRAIREHSPDETYTAKSRMEDNDDVQSFKSTKSRSNRPSGKNKILSLKLFN